MTLFSAVNVDGKILQGPRTRNELQTINDFWEQRNKSCLGDLATEKLPKTEWTQ